jgi:hypothetical protein
MMSSESQDEMRTNSSLTVYSPKIAVSEIDQKLGYSLGSCLCLPAGWIRLWKMKIFLFLLVLFF